MLPDAEERPTLPLWPDVGKILGLGRTATYEAAKNGLIPTIRLGPRSLVVPTAKLRALLGLETAKATSATVP